MDAICVDSANKTLYTCTVLYHRGAMAHADASVLVARPPEVLAVLEARELRPNKPLSHSYNLNATGRQWRLPTFVCDRCFSAILTMCHLGYDTVQGA